jgi:predicted Zn finger-like uncharacterized protein
MIVDCHSCGATYNISDEKIRGRKVRVRCKSCSEGIIVDGTRVDLDEATRVYSPTFEPAAYGRSVHEEATRVVAPSGPDLRATAASPEEWIVNVGESEQRTMDLAELVSSYNGGLIPDEALVWREGMDDWQKIRDVPEIQAAIESNEATHVVSPAMAVRAPRRAVGDRAVGRRSDPEPARARMPSLVDVEPVAVRARMPSMVDVEPAPPPARGQMPSLVELEPGPPPPPRARMPSVVDAEPPRPRAPSLVDVNAPARRIRSAPPPGERTARVREGRAQGADLFGNIEQAGGEEALLGSSALSQYDEKPIGARNESSVLFSLDALKAGARRGSSAPPRHPGHPTQTAADILGMTAGGALPGIGAGSALLAAPVAEAYPSAVPTTPPRSKMDTLPPMMRPRRSSALPIFAVVGAVVVVALAFFVLRQRLSSPTKPPEATAEQAGPRTTETTTAVARAPEPPPADTTTADTVTTAAAAQTAAPEAHPTTAARAAQGDGVTAPVLPSKPTTPSTASYEAARAAMRPERTDPAPKPAADKAPKAAEKVVLAEESSGSDNSSSDTPAAEEAPKPAFDTSAAKAALEAASSSAASCKKDDGPTGRGKVQVTFAPTGRATSANVIEGPFGGTPVGGCVAKLFRGAKVPAFSGDAVTVSKSFTIPE